VTSTNSVYCGVKAYILYGTAPLPLAALRDNDKASSYRLLAGTKTEHRRHSKTDTATQN